MATDLSNLIFFIICIFVVLYNFILGFFRHIKLFFRLLRVTIYGRWAYFIYKGFWERFTLIICGYALTLFIGFFIKYLHATQSEFIEVRRDESGFTIIACLFTVTMLINTNICRQRVFEPILSYIQDLQTLSNAIYKDNQTIHDFTSDILTSPKSIFRLSEAPRFFSQVITPTISKLRELHSKADNALYDYNIFVVTLTFIYAAIRIFPTFVKPESTFIGVSVMYFVFFSAYTIGLLRWFSKLKNSIKQDAGVIDKWYNRVAQVQEERIGSLEENVSTLLEPHIEKRK